MPPTPTAPIPSSSHPLSDIAPVFATLRLACCFNHFCIFSHIGHASMKQLSSALIFTWLIPNKQVHCSVIHKHKQARRFIYADETISWNISAQGISNLPDQHE
ncbi:hypothetical protein [Burkholderia ubonensis]|uniref:hypothetical protein n=1 Tax=Burkholderia ubonensis TaxID=101571 RepID=UPI0010553234|nr:hypothetical protein [Burkholderia ubonensis]